MFLMMAFITNAYADNYRMPTGEVVCRLGDFVISPQEGTDQIWDFRDTEIGEPLTFIWWSDGDSYITYQTGASMLTVSRLSDSISVLKEETPMWCKYYRKSPIINIKNLQFGDTICNYYEAKGNYCGRFDIYENGQQIIKYDAEGMVYLCSGQIIDGIYRIHSTNSSTIVLSLGNEEMNNVFPKQIIKDTYSWYRQGKDIPFYLTEETKWLSDGNVLYQSRNAYWFERPDTMINKNNDKITDSPDTTSFKYEITVQGGMINISCFSEEDVNLNIIVSDVQGVMYANRQEYIPKGEYTTIKINYNNMRPGEYILYIHKGRETYIEKVCISH